MGLRTSAPAVDGNGHTIDPDAVYVCWNPANIGHPDHPDGIVIVHGLRRRGDDELVQTVPAFWYRDGDPEPLVNPWR